MNDEHPADSQTSRDQPSSSLSTGRPAASLPVPAMGTTDLRHDVPSRPTGPSGTSDVQVRLQFAEATHQYIRAYINAADQKATFFFTGATALLAFLYRINVSGRWLKPVMDWNIIDAVSFIAMVALAAGALSALLVIIPRTPGSRRGFIFWEAIAEYDTGRHYADELSMLSPASLFQVKAEHCFDLAGVCRRKYQLLRWALCICGVGLAASLIVFLTSVGERPASDPKQVAPASALSDSTSESPGPSPVGSPGTTR